MLRKSDISNVKTGAVLSYILIILNTVYGLIITPYILFSVGEIEYGVYKTIASLSASLMVMDLGIGGMITRYIAKYKAERQESKISDFVSMTFGEGSILILIVASVCSVIYAIIPNIYRNGLNTEQILLARNLFFVLALNICFHIIDNILDGIISGHNKFTIGNSIKIIRLIIRILLTYVLLLFVKKSLVLVLLDLLLSIMVIIIEIIYIKYFLHIALSIKIRGWDKQLFLETTKYAGLMFLTTIAAQVNSNLDNVVIGAELGAGFVSIYSMGLAIFAMFENLSTSISGVMLPTVMNVLAYDLDGKMIKNLVVRVGRIQFILLGAALGGFAVLGKEFIQLWLGNGFEDVYVIVLILMGPALLELCVNVCLAILRAKNKLGFRTVVLSVVTVMNAIITIIGVRQYGYYAAAIGTALSFFIGSVIVMNIYYDKVLSMSMATVYKAIFGKTWICILISAIITRIASGFFMVTWATFIICVLIFMFIFLALMGLFGFTKEERDEIKVIFKH